MTQPYPPQQPHQQYPAPGPVRRPFPVLAGILAIALAGAVGAVAGGVIRYRVDVRPPAKHATGPLALPSPFPGDTPYLPGLTMTKLQAAMTGESWLCHDDKASPGSAVAHERLCSNADRMLGVSMFYQDATHVRSVWVMCTIDRTHPHGCDATFGDAAQLVFIGRPKALSDKARAWATAHGRADEHMTIGGVILVGSVEGTLMFDAAG